MVASLSAQEKVSMDFVNVDIAVVVKYISELTGKNFVIDEKVQGKVTIISPKKVTKYEAYKVFESILEVYGFTAIPMGNVVKIIPIAEARQKAGRVQTGPKVSRELRDQMVTQLIPLKSVSASELIKIIRPLIPPTSFVAAYSPSNTLILVDLAANRTRIMNIIKKLDVEGIASMVKVHRLEHASAKDIAQKINAVLVKRAAGKGAKKTDRQFNVIADDRLNALIIVGNKLFVDKVMSLIAKLDVESPPGRQEINVVYLKNAEAEDLAKVINNIVKGMKKLARGKGKKPTAATADKIMVTPDVATNSLLITAAPEDFETLKDVIQKLDIPRRQVFVEALIFEISTDDTLKFGVEWRTTSNFTKSGVQGIGGTNFGTINQVAANPFSAGTGLVVGVVDGVISFGGQTFANIGGLISALQTETGINILSTPNILTTDNEEAEIFVGENVPFIKTTSTTVGGQAIENIERKDIGIILRIKPQINESDYVKLDIYQEISSVRPTQVGIEARDIITAKRSVQTSVTVKNKQNIIIGGLIKEDMVDTVQKVPILGDIPILGWLFKSKSKQRIKTNLLIFLTPHIINRAEDLVDITEERKKLMEKLKNKKGGQGGKSKPDVESRTAPATETAPAETVEPEREITRGQEIVLLGLPTTPEADDPDGNNRPQNVVRRGMYKMLPGR
jgi:general secretion pathway protein D